jgi:hypothetical protein
MHANVGGRDRNVAALNRGEKKRRPKRDTRTFNDSRCVCQNRIRVFRMIATICVHAIFVLLRAHKHYGGVVGAVASGSH